MMRMIVKRWGRGVLSKTAREWFAEERCGTVVLFSPHYDDETLGAGGAIAMLRDLGVTVHVVFMTDGSTSHAQAMPAEELSALRRAEGLRATAVLGVDANHVHFFEYPEKRLEQHREEVTERVAALLLACDCERVFVPSTLEPLIWSADHLATTGIVFEAMRRTGRQFEVLEYLVWFWYHWPWVPVFGSGDICQLLKLSWKYRFGSLAWQGALNATIDIAAVRPRKQAALAEHRTKMISMVDHRPWPILADVGRGEFLENFFQTREWFKAHTFPPQN